MHELPIILKKLASPRIESEKNTLRFMVRYYCRKHHGGIVPCPECADLLAYAINKLDHCRYGETKKPVQTRCGMPVSVPPSRNGKIALMTTCKPGDVVDVPFPFIDTPVKKLRPALVVSDPRIQQTTGAIVLMMITSAERSNWETDIKLDDWHSAGLRKASIVRWKIFPIDETLIISRRGTLSEKDQQKISDSLKNNLSHWLSR